jgi:glycosyltransferase involved in cell wall biosynthesis
VKLAFLMYGLAQNGGNKVLFRVGNLLHERGHDVCYYVAETRRDLPFPSHCQFVFAPRPLPNALRRVPWLARVPMDADVAIATSHATAYSLVLNKSTVPRRMYYVQAYEPDFYSDSIGHLLRRWPMMLAAGASYLLPLETIVNCEGSRRGLTSRNRVIAPELPPGIDLKIYRPHPRPGGTTVIGHISRREHWKGSDHFFRAMVHLRQSGHDFTVRVAYDLWPKTRGLQYESVHPHTEAELAAYYSSVDILVSTVTQKGFGYPPLEAMASGALCISTPMDFGKPMVDHIPILAYSTESIVSAVEMAMTLRDPAAMISAGLSTATKYDWNILADRWCDLLSGASST